MQEHKKNVYVLKFKKSALRELADLEKKLRERILSVIETLSSDPTPPQAIKLKGNLPLWRIRVGSYRVLYEIKDDVFMVYVIKVAHRKEVYQNL